MGMERFYPQGGTRIRRNFLMGGYPHRRSFQVRYIPIPPLTSNVTDGNCGNREARENGFARWWTGTCVD